MKKVSVIVPAYNAEKYLEVCLNSLVSQTYGNIEIIVVDDGSADRTPQILQTYEGIKVMKSNRGGVSNARNIGLREASGDYIMFVDSDDYIDAGAVETLVSMTEKYNADIVHFSLRYVDGNEVCTDERFMYGSGTFIEKHQFPEKIYGKMISGIQFNAVWRNFYKKTVLEGVFFETGMRTAEDLLFNIKAFTNAENCLCTDKVRYNYRRTGGGLTGKTLALREKYRCNKIAAGEMKKSLKKWGMDNAYYRCAVSLRQARITVSKVVRLLRKR